LASLQSNFLTSLLAISGLPILLLPPQQCFGSICFFAEFFRVFNAFSTSNQPKCISMYSGAAAKIKARVDQFLHARPMLRQFWRFQIMLGLWILQNVKLA
jgi:hypothetical protein